MGPEPGLYCAGAASPLGNKLLKHCHDALWADSRSHDVVEPLIVRFQLILSAESREDGPSREVDRGAGNLTVADTCEDAGEGDADIRSLRFFHLLHGVASNYVADLVAENSRYLVHPVGALDQATIDVDEAAGNCESVDVLGIDDEEVPVQIAPTGEAGDRITEDIDVAIQLRI